MIYHYHLSKNSNHLKILLVSDDKTLGFIYLSRIFLNSWEILSVASFHGYGHYMYEAAMDLIDDYILPSRNKQITTNIISIYKKFLQRKDICTKLIYSYDKEYVNISNEHNFWFNCKYKLKNKLQNNYEENTSNFVISNGLKLFNSLYNYDGGCEYLT